MVRLQDNSITPEDVLKIIEKVLKIFEKKATSLCTQLKVNFPKRLRDLFAANGFISFVINQFVRKEFIKKGISPLYDDKVNNIHDSVSKTLGFDFEAGDFSLSSLLAFEDKSEKFSKYNKQFRDPQSSFSEKANAAIESVFLLLSMSKLLNIQIPGIFFNVKLVKIGYRTMYRYNGFQNYRDKFSNFYIKSKYRKLSLYMPNSFFMGQKSSERTWTYIRVFYARGNDDVLDFWLYENPQSNTYYKLKGIWGLKQAKGEVKANIYFASFHSSQTLILGKCLEHLTAKGIDNINIANLNFYAADTRFFCYPTVYYCQCDNPGYFKEIRF